MKRRIVGSLLLIFSLGIAAGREPSIEIAAARYVPGVSWHRESVVTADFTCQGRKQQAIAGTSPGYIEIAVFLNGTNKRPERLRYSAKARNPVTTTLTTEDLDYDPQSDLGYVLPGFRRSITCKGLNLSDGDTDSAHIYW